MRTHPPIGHMASRLGCRPPWPPCRRWTRRSSTPPERRVRTWQALADPDGDRDRHEHLHTNLDKLLADPARTTRAATLAADLARENGPAQAIADLETFVAEQRHTPTPIGT